MSKILHISKYYFPYFGGIEDVARTIVLEFKPYHEQRIIAFNTSKDTVDEVVDDIPITRIGVHSVLFSQPLAVSCRRHIERVLKVFKPGFIHLHLPNPLVATVLLKMNLYGAKIVSHWHSDVLGKDVLYTLYRPFERKILERSYKIISTSERYLFNSKPLQPYLETKSVVLANTINEDKLKLVDGDTERIAEIKRRWGKKIILSVGRHVAYKGLSHLISVSDFLRADAEIVIIGDGPVTASLKRQAEGNNRVHFLGHVSNDELRCYFHAADLFAFPSDTKAEAFGVALAEALYCGVPAVTFDVPGSGISWVNKHDVSGKVVPLGDLKGFASAVDEILSDDVLYSRLSNGAHEWVVQNFSRNIILPTLEKVYGSAQKIVPRAVNGVLNVSVVLYRNKFEEVRRLVE
jgi:Glycosyltransferase